MSGTPCLFPELSIEAKKSLIQYAAIDGDVESGMMNELDQIGFDFSEGNINWNVLFTYFDIVWSERAYTTYDMPTEELTLFLMSQDCDFASEFSSFHEYHLSYLDKNTPYHTAVSRWPCIASDPEEGILDGWHRLHSYYRSGHSTIPLIV
jgi:hypothetical protein